jgi:DMSO/TMAO reductase YedYZ heme-binding membrane subunit
MTTCYTELVNFILQMFVYYHKTSFHKKWGPLVKYISRIGIVVFNLTIGYISFWWVIFSSAAAFNIDHEAENEIFIPFGIIALLILFIGVIGGNWTIYKYKNRAVKGLMLEQIVPFVLGLSISLFLAAMRS